MYDRTKQKLRSVKHFYDLLLLLLFWQHHLERLLLWM